MISKSAHLLTCVLELHEVAMDGSRFALEQGDANSLPAMSFSQLKKASRIVLTVWLLNAIIVPSNHEAGVASQNFSAAASLNQEPRNCKRLRLICGPTTVVLYLTQGSERVGVVSSLPHIVRACLSKTSQRTFAVHRAASSMSLIRSTQTVQTSRRPDRPRSLSKVC